MKQAQAQGQNEDPQKAGTKKELGEEAFLRYAAWQIWGVVLGSDLVGWLMPPFLSSF